MKKMILLLTVLTLVFSCKNEELEEFMDDSINPPTFNFMAGTYKYDIGVTLAMDTKDAIIYYTIDGTEPTENSLIYKSPIIIDKSESSMYIKAMSKNGHGVKSKVTESYYRIDYSFNPEIFNNQLELSDFQDKFQGTWIGSRSTPWTSDINVEITFNKEGTYSSKSLTPDNVGFYYGSDDEVNSYTISDVNSDGSAMGKIGRFNDSSIGDMKFIKFSEDLNVLSFEFWNKGENGPLKYTLTRIE